MSSITQKLLLHHEITIERGLKSFIEVGEALLEIKQNKLYKEQYKTFSEYCEQRWGFSIRQSQRYISALKVVQNIQESDPEVALPISERQIRSLGSLAPEEQYQVWKEAIQDDATSSSDITMRVKSINNQTQEKNNTALFTSDSCEWYTPQNIIDVTLKVLGNIDLDPCSNSFTYPNIPASQHFTKEVNGLSKNWIGKVYMNPPYGREIKEWVEKLHQGFSNGNVTEAIALTPARTDTQWFYALRNFPRCFIKGRLKFSGGEEDNSAPFPSVAFYLGKNESNFKKHFKEIGDIYSLL